MVDASDGLRDSPIVSTPLLFSGSSDTAGSETIAPSGSDEVVDHGTCGPTRSKVNDVNDTSSRSKTKSSTGVEWIMAPVTQSNPVAIVLMVMILLVVMS